MIVALRLNDHILAQADAGLDTTTYVSLAERVVAGDWALGPGLYYVSPLYIYFLAVVLAITHSFFAVRLTQIVLGTMAVWLVFVAADAWFGRRAAWFAACLAALTGILTFYESLLLQSALDPFLTAAGLAALSLAQTRDRPRLLALSGVLFGLQSLNRPNIIIAAGGMLLMLAARKRWRAAAVFAAGVAIALVPITLRNAIVVDRWTPMPSHGGLNFYIGNNELADGTYRAVPGITPNLSGQQEDARRVASAALGHDVDDAEASSYFLRSGVQWISSHPRDAAKLSARKASLLLSSSYVWLNYSYPFFIGEIGWPLWLLFVGPWLLIPVGVGCLFRRSTAKKAPDPFITFALFYAVSILIFFVADRYTLPLLVALAITAGASIDTLIADAGQRRWRTVAVTAGGIAVVMIVVCRPVSADNGVAEERTRMAERLVTLGRYSEAQQWTERAAQISPRAGIVHFRVGQRLMAAGQTSAAAAQFESALRIDPGQPEVEYILGQAYLDAQQPGSAVQHLRRALAAGFRQRETSIDLIRALGASGDTSGATNILESVHPNDDPQSSLTLGDLAMQLRQPALAEPFFQNAADHGEPVRGHFGLAAAAAAQGRREDARREVKEVLKLDPAFTPAQRLNAVLNP